MTSRSTVHLGFEVGSGEPVSIPINHLVVTGQTQMAGKTTALEALIARAGVTAVAFITKRGEGGFADARTIAPYFSERADWKYVASILEASRGEKLKFERAWIIRASKGAQTLKTVQRNVQRALETAKGMSADVYLTLDAYLEDVVPQINRVKWADRVELQPGVNAMDLTGITQDMQHLVIRSTLEWVLANEENTVVVLPEAWKFIPQGRGTPVKLAAESFIRQAAALRNYLWLDSQDIAGVEKIILKSVPVWILGVQRESNEVKRTLEQIPAGIKKPKADAISTLSLGQFFACHGTHITKVYAQPAWMDQDEARAIAAGELVPPAPREVEVNEREAKALREENAELRNTITRLQRRVDELMAMQGAPSSNDSSAAVAPRGRHRVQSGDAGSTPVGATRTWSLPESLDNESLYQAIKQRLIAELPTDPAVMRIVVSRPELTVQVEREVISIDGKTLRGRIARLLAEGFWDEAAKTTGDVLSELQRRGGNDVMPNVARELGELTVMGFLTKDNKWYRLVPGAKVNIEEPAYR